MKRYGLSPDLPSVGDWVTFGGRGDEEARDWVYLGRLSEYGRQSKVRFAVQDEKVIAIFGKRGQGKSFTLGALLESLALKDAASEIGVVSKPRASLLIDPLNVFQWIDVPLTDAAAERSDELSAQVARARAWGLSAEDIVARIYYPAGYPESSFRADSIEFRVGVDDFGLDEWATLLGFDMIRDVRGQLVAEVFEKVTRLGWEAPATGPVPAASRPSVGDYIACVAQDAEINSGIYTRETVRAVLQRLRSIEAFEVFRSPGTPLRDLLVPGSVSVLLLNSLPADLRHVIVSALVRRILTARSLASGAQKDLMLNPDLSGADRMARQEIVDNAPPKTWIVIDEAQDIIPGDRKTAATDSIIKLVKEGRNFGLSFVLTTQQPIAVDARVLSQVETFIVHKLVARADIDRTLDNLKCPVPDDIRDGEGQITMPDLVASLEVGQAMISDTFARRCAVIEIRARIGAHGGFEA